MKICTVNTDDKSLTWDLRPSMSHHPLKTTENPPTLTFSCSMISILSVRSVTPYIFQHESKSVKKEASERRRGSLSKVWTEGDDDGVISNPALRRQIDNASERSQGEVGEPWWDDAFPEVRLGSGDVFVVWRFGRRGTRYKWGAS
jgi:hypothetical protein